VNYVELETEAARARLYPRVEAIEASITFGDENRASDISRLDTWD
jgi:hypothetical protein